MASVCLYLAPVLSLCFLQRVQKTVLGLFIHPSAPGEELSLAAWDIINTAPAGSLGDRRQGLSLPISPLLSVGVSRKGKKKL